MMLSKRLIALAVFAVFAIANVGSLRAQAPAIEWEKSLGGTGDDAAYSIQQTRDGGYIVAGYSNSTDGDVTGNHGDYDFWIVKLTSTGSIEWQKSFGGTGYDWANAIQQTSDDGYIVAGRSESNDGDVTGHHGIPDQYDYWIVKLTRAGAIEWQKSFGGSRDDIAYAVQQTSDGGYVIAGQSGSYDGDVTNNHAGYGDAWIVKLTSAGDLQWQKCLGGSGEDGANSIQQTRDGGYIVAGYSYSNDGDVSGHHYLTNYADYWVVKLTSAGAIEWQKSYGGTGEDQAASIEQTNDGGYIVAGYSYSNDGDVTGHHGDIVDPDYWVVKLTSAGGIEWQKSLGGDIRDVATSVQQTDDGDYIVAGYINEGDYGTGGEFGMIKLTSAGDTVWEKVCGGHGSSSAPFRGEAAMSICQTHDGGFVVAGNCGYNDGDVTGHHGTSEWGDFWIVKLAPDESSVAPVVDSGAIGVICYPNPFSQSTTITFTPEASGYANVSIVNLLGVEVARIFSGELAAGEHTFTWDAQAGSTAPRGMYECLIRMNGRVETLPVMLLR